MEQEQEKEDTSNWNETPAERRARLEKERLMREKALEQAKEQHLLNKEMCGELVEHVLTRVFRVFEMREMHSRARMEAEGFAEAAMMLAFKGGISWRQDQKVAGGPLAAPWRKEDVLSSEQVEQRDTRREGEGGGMSESVSE